MPRITKILKLVLRVLAVIFLIVGVLWYPYKSGAVPEWRIQVIDTEGHPVAGIHAIEEWVDPLEEGMTPLDIRETDTQGFVVFPRRQLHSRLAFGPPQYQPAGHVYMCGEGQYGQAFWDAKDREMVTKLELKKGPCPYA
jgi:hypothetical protein